MFDDDPWASGPQVFPCPDCGGDVVLEEDTWRCVEPGGCNWSALDASRDVTP